MPDIHGDGAGRLAGDDDLEELRRRGEISEQRVLQVSGERLRKREMPEHGEDVFFRGSEGRLQSRSAELEQRVALEEMPRNACAQRDRALESLGGLLRRGVRGSWNRGVWVED